MMNFLLGTLAGGLVASIAIIAAARHPEVQIRLGLVTAPKPITMAAPPQPQAECPCSSAKTTNTPVGQPEMLFSRRRFWSITP